MTIAQPFLLLCGCPAGVESTAVVEAMHDRWNVTVGDGEARLNGKIIRIGHLGFISEVDVEYAVAALGAAIAEVGVSEQGAA